MGPTGGQQMTQMSRVASAPPQRVESLRRSLDAIGLRTHAAGTVEFEDVQSPRGPGHAGLGWRSADVQRRRSLDTARRTSRGRYANPSFDLNRSTSVGSARPKSQSDAHGLFAASGQLVAPSDANHRLSSQSLLAGRMRTLSEHSANP
ncbi:hypothetical protein VP01_3080g2 [Puccinia sorghi]|uniref:Uncharacterized protein n=1 Tax=Puccinia sorghi TaxID=27349 RepID=A0A0L6UZS3_9BASI|nr:hypothetical protein VP01_3080g2 [Puccinia sorghi]